MQIYADVLGLKLRVTENMQTAALGSAIYAAVAARKRKGRIRYYCGGGSSHDTGGGTQILSGKRKARRHTVACIRNIRKWQRSSPGGEHRKEEDRREKKQYLTTLKTQNSYRRIPFIGDVEEALKVQREKQKKLKKDLKDPVTALLENLRM